MRFLLQSLMDLSFNLNKLNLKLYCIKGKPNEVFENVFKKWNVNYLSYQIDIDPEIIQYDNLIEELAIENDVFVVKRSSQTLYDPREVIKKNNGRAPLTYQKFLSIIATMHIKNVIDNIKPVSQICIPTEDPAENENPDIYRIPTLSDCGIEESQLGECLYPGGESEGQKTMYKVLLNKEWICKFQKPNTSPNSLNPSTTVLSPYISSGCLSSTLFYNNLKDIERNSSHTEPPVSLLGQLMWREFYYSAAYGTTNFDKMVGNPICIQIPWHTNTLYLTAWEDGQTGYPFVDAIMRQLKQEGWIHHLARHMVACFLTRGDLWISWEDGMKVFEKYLLDYDWALNTGNWLWLSASAFFYKYYRVYSPVAFGKKTDKNGDYIRKYVNELKKFPAEFIYEPWKAPLNVQKSAGCIIGIDYPNRIIEHEIVHKDNITKMASSYKLNREKKSLKRPVS